MGSKSEQLLIIRVKRSGKYVHVYVQWSFIHIVPVKKFETSIQIQALAVTAMVVKSCFGHRMGFWEASKETLENRTILSCFFFIFLV